MTRTGQKVVSTLLLALAVVLFLPAFLDAPAELPDTGWQYAPFVELILENIPILLAAAAVLVLAAPLDRGGP